MKLNNLVIIGVAATTVASCAPSKKEYASYELYPVRTGSLAEMEYAPAATQFTLWSPTADEVRLMLYDAGEGGHAYETVAMSPAEDGTWTAKVEQDLKGKFYTFNVKINGKWLGDTPGINAQAVGVNGKRAAVIDMRETDPEGWAEDKRPPLASPADVIIYEVHHRDFSIDPSSGIRNKGKFLAMTETGTVNPDKLATGIDHLKELGVTHVHILPSYDYASVDESRLDENKYNWGYDPLNYNLPEGSYATDAFHGEVRVRECRAMIQALHSAGLGVVMDVVYNHTYYSYSWLERTVPGYWNRRWENGSLTNGSGCGCDLASERTMVRKYLVDSCVYWAKEYHIDGFRFDLMALHDVETMNAIRAALDALPGGEDILMYGEPWQGGSTRMEHGAIPANKQAAGLLDSRIGFFCDNTRDAIKGGVFNAGSAGYINGDMHCGYQVLHSIPAWRGGQADFMPQAPGQVVQYVSAHDNYTLWDKLKCVAHRGDYAAPDADLLAQNRMAAGIYLTCQGLPFMQGGEEFARTKHGDHNTYRGPLELNRLDWTRAAQLEELVQYYHGLLEIRKAYPELSGMAGDAEPCILSLPGWLIGFVPERRDESLPGRLAVYYNPERTCQWAALPAGSWRYLCDGTRAAAEPFGPACRNAIELAPVSVTILKVE